MIRRWAYFSGLFDAGAVVICGGKEPRVIATSDNRLAGVEAIVDKDCLAALLGIAVGADRLQVLTDAAALLAGTARTTITRSARHGVAPRDLNLMNARS